MSIYALNDIFPVLPEDNNYWVASDANIVGNVILNPGASVWFGATVRGDNEKIIIGEGTNIQENSVLHTDHGFPLTIGKNCTVGHKAMLHGCTINNNTLIGMGATILNGAIVGENCLIGACSLIPEGKKIPAGSLVMGVPGKVVRELDSSSIERIRNSALWYQKNMLRFKNELSKIR